jgi:hypothetical protein
MNLLTLLQYLGIDDKERIIALHTKYSINDFPKYLKKQAIDYLALKADSLSDQEEYINSKLEELFSANKSFSEFYCDYQNLIKDVNKTTRRQINYYYSWAYTLSYLNVYEAGVQEQVLRIIDEFHIPDGHLSRVNPFLDFKMWIDNNLFEVYYSAIAKLFFRLGSNNLIPIDSIPHVFRGEKDIKELFLSFGMENLLPSILLEYDVHEITKPVYVQVKDVIYLRQFINLYTFFFEVDAFRGIPIFLKSELDLKELLVSNLEEENFTIVNLKNKFNNFLLPMMYSSHFKYAKDQELLILAPFNKQNYHILSEYGQLLDDNGYYDFCMISKTTGYFQYLTSLRWVRIYYDKKTNKIEKHFVEVDNPYEEGAWAAVEDQFQRNNL